MIQKVMKEIEKEDNRRIKEMGGIWSISRRIKDLDEFLGFLLDYFEIKDLFRDHYKFDSTSEFLRQEHKKLNYIMYLLNSIKPFLLLAYKLSELKDTSEIFEKHNINEDSIVNMLDNFTQLKRTGRPKKFYPKAQKEFKKFKEKNQNIIDFLREIKSNKVKSMRDYANTIKKYQISKEQLNSYIFRFSVWKKRYKEWSRATLYRFDKDLIFLGHNYFWVKDTLRKFSTYQEILELDSLKKDQKN